MHLAERERSPSTTSRSSGASSRRYEEAGPGVVGQVKWTVRNLLGSLTFAAMHRQAMKVTGLLEGLPLSLLGHSAGMALIYELCMHLKRHWGYRPQRVINVALPPPDVRTRSGQRASP